MQMAIQRYLGRIGSLVRIQPLRQEYKEWLLQITMVYLGSIPITPHYGEVYFPILILILSYGVIGNTSDFESEESRFEPWWDN